MNVTTGRTVLYILSEADCQKINDQRREFEKLPNYTQIFGNPVRPGDVVPAIVVKPWADNYFNGQAILDGCDTLWLMSVKEGTEPGTWHWPERV